MKNVYKRILVAFMLCASVFSVMNMIPVLNAEETIVPEEEGGKTVSTIDEYLIGSWISFYDTSIVSYEDQLKDFAASGMNFVDLPTNLSNGSMENTEQFWTSLDEMAQENNVYYLYQSKDYTDFSGSYRAAMNLQNCIGYSLKDEPSSALIPALAEIFLQYKNGDSERFPFVNMYPNYAGATNLGGSYSDYINQWVNTIGSQNLEYLYFDNYPFTQTENVRSSYFSDLETIREVAYDNNRLKTGGFTQMGSWNGMTRPTVDMARWSCYSLVSYGMKSISHFNWVAPAYRSTAEGGEGMLDFVLSESGNKTDLYEPMQILNWQIRQLGNLLMSMDVKHAYHTANVPTGTETLPANFILQPGNEEDDFVYSLAYSEDDSSVYLMVFNKATAGENKSYDFSLDLSTGIEGLTYYKPTEFTSDTLPDPTDLSTLGTPEEQYVDVTSGSMSMNFAPGEMKLFKLEGESVTIYEDLAVPSCSLSSGTYIGSQSVTLTTGDTGAEIYYTTDGSFPEPGKGTTKRFTDSFTIGVNGVLSFETIRAISVRGTELSALREIDLVITDASKNAAKGIVPSFMSLDMTTPLFCSGFNGAATNPKLITDGSFHPESSVVSLCDAGGNPARGWAILDLGKVESINKVVISFWHDWVFSDVIVEAAVSADFSDAVTLYTGTLANTPTVGTTLDDFGTISAQYLRVTNRSSSSDRTIITEFQAYTAYESGEDLVSDQDHWIALGGSTWTNDGSEIKLNGSYNTVDWDRAYGYTASTYQNFILDATITFNVTDPGAWGYAGFGLYRPLTTNVQSDYDQGYIVGIEPKGRALIWNGAKPELGPLDANISGWTLGSAVDIRIVALNGIISLSVNGEAVMQMQASNLDREAGYISIHAGLVPITISALSVTSLDDVETFPQKQQAVAEAKTTKIAVDRYVSKANVIAALGSTAEIFDQAGNRHTVAIEWTSEEYDRSLMGTFKFTGVLDAAVLQSLGLVNPYGVTASAEVFVKSDIDTTEVDKLLAKAYSLKESDYTPESWEYLELKVAAAEAILTNEFMVQSDVNVGSFQLYDAIHALESVVDKSVLTSKLATAKAVEKGQYTDFTFGNLVQAIVAAEAVLQDEFASSADLAEAINDLESAQRALEKSVVVDELLDEPADLEIPAVEETGCGNPVAGSLVLFATLIELLSLVLLRKKQ